MQGTSPASAEGTHAPTGQPVQGPPLASSLATPTRSIPAGPVPASAAPPPEPETPAEARVREDALLATAAAARSAQVMLARAFAAPAPEPPQHLDHQTLLLREMTWLATDFGQVLPNPCVAVAGTWGRQHL